MKQRFALACCVIVTAVLLVAAVLPVGAQIPTESIPPISPTPILPGDPSPTPSPTPSPSSQPPSQPSQPPSDRSSQPSGSGRFQAPPPTTTAGGLPLLVIPDIKRSPSRTTARLLEIVAPLTDRGFPLDRAMVLAAAPFPVAGYSWFSDDYMFPRYTPVPHLHEGTDIFADFGTPVVASAPGVVAAMANTSIGGIAMWFAADDGNSLYYGHLLSFAEGLQPGQHVEMGTVLGYVGNTGNAFTTSPHVHFEVHPPIRDRKGRIVMSGVAAGPLATGQTRTPPVNPKPYLDRWLIEAERRAQSFVGQLVQRLNALQRQIHFSRRVDDLFSAEALGRSGDLVMLSALDPVLGPVGLARQTVADSRLSGGGGSFAERTEAQQRTAAVTLFLEAADLKLAALTGAFNFAQQNGVPSG